MGLLPETCEYLTLNPFQQMVNEEAGGGVHMSAISLLSLLGFALLIPVFMDNDADESEAPTEPDTLEGTEGDDLIETTGGQSANGFGGNDT